MNLKKLNDDLAVGIDKLLVSSNSLLNQAFKNYGTLIGIAFFAFLFSIACLVAFFLATGQ